MQKVGIAILALACVVAVSAAELYAAEDVSEAQYNVARDGSAELNGDSPVRQAQRARRDERAPQAGVSLMETAAAVDKYHGANGPALNRLTGAAKTFHPNDQMCVMCQFLVQRVQLDMAHFNVLGGFLGVKAAGAGGKDNAAAGGDNGGAKAAAEESAFLEIASGFGADDASKDWEAEDAEDAAAMELAAKQELAEADGNWDAVAALEAKSHAVVQAAEDMAAEDAEATGEDEESEDEAEDEADDEEVEEEGAEFEEEDSEHAVAQQLAASSFAEASSEVIASGLTAVERREMEEVMAEMRDDRVAESVNKQLADGMESTPVLVETAAASDDEAGDEAALGDAFEHELDLSADEKEDLSQSLHGGAEADSEFTTPSYNADGQAASFESDAEVVEAQTEADEDMALLQVEEEDSDESESANAEAAEADAAAEEELEGMADNVQLVETAANPHAPRSYARTLHVADADAAQPVLAEMSGTHASFQSNGGLAQVYTRQQMQADAQAHRCYTQAKVVSRVKKCERIENTNRRRCKVTTKKRVPAGCSNGAGGRRTVGISNSPRRFRLADALHSRPRWNRWDPTVKPHPDPARAKAREMWHHLMQMTYDRLEGYCSTRLPEQFTPFCRPLLRRFRVVAEGIRYGDRPNQICMRTRFCPRGSYVRRSPHNVFKHMKVGF